MEREYVCSHFIVGVVVLTQLLVTCPEDIVPFLFLNVHEIVFLFQYQYTNTLS